MHTKLRLIRLKSNQNATIGVLQTPWGTYASCEDEPREDKVPGETRIPPGTYNLGLRGPESSGMAARYREKFGNWHLGMVEIKDIPGFTDVYIHIGNDEGDTEGCPLIGQAAYYENMTIGRSRVAYTEFARGAIEYLDGIGELRIEVVDMDGGGA